MTPKLSIIVIFYDMQREAARTLTSLAVPYQQGVTAEDYEVIAIDNGSAAPVRPEDVTRHGPNFRHHLHQTASPSPTEAINLGVEMAAGDLIAVIIDGARMASPGLIRRSLQGAALAPDPLVCALSMHLGPGPQRQTQAAGYDQAAEDEMLAKVDWQADGYRLFDVAVLAPSSRAGFTADVPPELSWFLMKRVSFQRLGGFDTRFQSPGGGLSSFEFRNRIATSPGIVPVLILGEAVFHQVHGKSASLSADGGRPMKVFGPEYERLVGVPFARAAAPAPLLVGQIGPNQQRFVAPDVDSPAVALPDTDRQAPSLELFPIAIGGIGGSGTRLLAETLQATGCYIGDALNPALDNLWFSLLLRQSAWFGAFPPESDIHRMLDLFHRAMTTGLSGTLTPGDEDQLRDLARLAAAPGGGLQPERMIPAYEALLASAPPHPGQVRRWGWKEPNTHIFLPQIAHRIPDIRYIHVVRNGLDMVFSRNQAQARNWRRFMLGAGAEAGPDQTSHAQALDYWIAANRRAISICEALLPGRHFLLSYDRLCAEPEAMFSTLLRFAGIEPNAGQIADLAARVKPGAIGRHKDQDLSVFTADQIAAVDHIGQIAWDFDPQP